MPFRKAVARLGFERRALAMHVPNWTRDGRAGMGVWVHPPPLHILPQWHFILFKYEVQMKK